MSFVTEIIAATDDPKRARILEGATRVFLAYGFARTTMDDIARAAEVSRPALYLLFRNKTDIYRAIAGELIAASQAQSARILASDLPLADRLGGAICGALLGLMDEIEQSPHGSELFDIKASLAPDLIADARGRLIAMFTAAIEVEAARLGTDLSARGLDGETLSLLLLDTLEGAKPHLADCAARQALASRLVKVVEAAIHPWTAACEVSASA
jgi:AcrR family transcriptional regulator